MSWIFQKKGKIDHFNPKFQKGNQPVRVLNNMVLYMFIHNEDDFHLKLIEAVIQNGMNPQVYIEHGDLPLMSEYGKFRTPFVDLNKKLSVHETFLSYCWIMSYSIFVL